MHNVNNFIVDHVIRGFMTKKNNEYMWSINNITEPSLNVTTENSQAVDALGTVIVEFDRARNAEFSANNSVFDLGLYAAQMGQEKVIASAEKKIEVPAFEEFTYDGTMTEYTTKHAPLVAVTNIYLMNGDGTLGKAFTAASAASENNFVYDADTHTITLPEGLTKGNDIFIMYEYETDKGTAVIADAINFPKTGKFIMEVLGCDTCDKETLVHAYLVFPSAKLDGNVDYSFTTEGNHPFTIKATQDYCDKEKKLFSIIIPDEE